MDYHVKNIKCIFKHFKSINMLHFKEPIAVSKKTFKTYWPAGPVICQHVLVPK